ncbi:hypothetical protein HanRHA438_Chr02g0092161 [Helianthus annuus]|nr:hypothetical protein HanRHA438_Chr02g0092161 [Helianthus annuus]
MAAQVSQAQAVYGGGGGGAQQVVTVSLYVGDLDLSVTDSQLYELGVSGVGLPEKATVGIDAGVCSCHQAKNVEGERGRDRQKCW